MSREEEILEKLRKALLEYNEEAIKNAAREALKEKIDPLKAIDVLAEAIREIGAKFERGEVFLPHLVIAADCMQAAIDILKEAIPKAEIESRQLGTVVIGTVKGDIHSIGKDLVALMLSVNGFRVINLGVDVPVERFVETAETENADIIAASSLLTTTMMEQKNLIEYLKATGKREKFKVLVGGAPVTEQWAREIGADGYAKDAIEAVKVAKKLIGKE